MIIIAETHEENEIVAKLAKEHSCRAYAREDAFGFTVWSVDDLKSKQPEISNEDAISFLENYESRLRESCVSGGWDFFDYADYSECPSLKQYSFEETNDKPTEDITTPELLAAFKECRGRWEDIRDFNERMSSKSYNDYILDLKMEWIGQKVEYEGKKYNVVDIDYNGMLLIDKKARFTDTTAVSISSVKRESSLDSKLQAAKERAQNDDSKKAAVKEFSQNR